MGLLLVARETMLCLRMCSAGVSGKCWLCSGSLRPVSEAPGRALWPAGVLRGLRPVKAAIRSWATVPFVSLFLKTMFISRACHHHLVALTSCHPCLCRHFPLKLCIAASCEGGLSAEPLSWRPAVAFAPRALVRASVELALPRSHVHLWECSPLLGGQAPQHVWAPAGRGPSWPGPWLPVPHLRWRPSRRGCGHGSCPLGQLSSLSPPLWPLASFHRCNLSPLSGPVLRTSGYTHTCHTHSHCAHPSPWFCRLIFWGPVQLVRCKEEAVW